MQKCRITIVFTKNFMGQKLLDYKVVRKNSYSLENCFITVTIRFVVVIKSLKNLPTNLRMEKEGVVVHIGLTFFLMLLHFEK